MDRKKVVSSNINSIGYDEKSMTLEVEFYDGKVYQYNPVTPIANRLLMSAESIGSYFSKNIKSNKEVTCTKVS